MTGCVARQAAAGAPEDAAQFRADVAATVARWVGPGSRAPDGGVVSLGDVLGELLFRLQQHKVATRGGGGRPGAAG